VLRIRTERASNEQHAVSLEVADNGPAPDAPQLARLFEPWQAAQEGHLGLALVYAMVKQNGGRITAEASDGGTVFRVTLPAAEERPAETPQPALPEFTASTGSSGETILILEQDDGLRNVVRNLLRRKGYTVVEAHSEGEASALLCGAAQLRLIVADVGSFGAGAARVARQMSEARPAAKALYILDTAGDSGRAAALPSGASVIEKPFRLESLLAKVREVLGE